MSAPISIPMACSGPLSSVGYSTSPSTSLSESPEIRLASSTIAMLDSFLAEKAEEERLFRELEEKALHGGLENAPRDLAHNDGKRGISVDEFKTAFAEDWQLSQFCWKIQGAPVFNLLTMLAHCRYTTQFAHKLAEAVHRVVPAPTESSNIAYICCPTGYIASQNLHQSATTLLLEFDQRFAVAAASSGGGYFIPYDLEEDNIPDAIKGTVELAIVDPPFLNEVTNRHLAKGLKQLLHPTKGKLVLITSTSVTCLPEVYGSVPQLGALRLTKLQPEHVGLKNDFACWTTWEAGDEFGGRV